jgi:hypothetical protein
MNFPERRSLSPTVEALAPSSIWRNLALQDWVLVVYLAVLLAVTIAGDGPRRTLALSYLSLDIMVFVVAIGLSRGKVLSGPLGAIVYRLGLFAAVFGSFAHLQYILPTARAVSVDAAIHAFDQRVFGIEPAQFFDRFVSPATVEWFSFFYFGYFFILAVHVFPFMFAVKNMRLVSELSFGIITLVCVGHLLYILVPGYGPYQHLAGSFSHELDGPFWWPLVKAAVDAGDVRARTDIFPSLHTAAPTFLALFSIRHRRLWPFRLTWPLMVFFASQIAISTMFLRWHYLVDVIAGLALAAGIARVSPRVVAWEDARRRGAGNDPVFTGVVR